METQFTSSTNNDILRDYSLDFGYFHPPKEFSNSQNIMLLRNDLSICTPMRISLAAQDAKQTREKLTYSKTTLKDPPTHTHRHTLILLFINVVCVSLLLGMRRHMQQHEVARLIQMLEDDSTQRDVTAAFGVTQSVVSQAWNRYLATGVYARRPGQGCLRCVTAQQDCYIPQMVVCCLHSTARALQMDFLQAPRQRISDQTVRNNLHDNGLHSRRPACGPIPTREHRRARLDFAQDHQHCHWRPILFTDESRFYVSTGDLHVRVWRPGSKLYADSNIVEYDRYDGGSMMVWDGIYLDGRTDIVVIDGGALTAVRYQDEVLEPLVRPFAGALGPDFVIYFETL